MIRAARILAAFSAAALGAGLARGLTTTYLPVLLDRIRDAPGLIGTVMLVNTVSGLFVPLVVGVWSDRLRARGHTRTLPFILGGSTITAGGLAAIALGHATSYLALAIFAAVAYAGMNAVTTAHRALIPETFPASSQAAATGWEEGALLFGSLLGVVAGGVLLEFAPWAPFAVGAAAIAALALPTALRRRDVDSPRREPPEARRAARYYLAAALRPRARLVLLAQTLWVLGYVGLTPFFVLFAEHELGLRPAVASLFLAGFGAATGLAMLGAGRVPVGYRPLALMGGAILMAVGLAAVAGVDSARLLVLPLLLAAIGFGLLTALGFPVYAASTPAGEEGAYSALYFAARSVAALIALPACGWIIAATGSYRAAFAFGGTGAALALAPLLVLVVPPAWATLARRGLVFAAGAVVFTAAVLALGFLAAETPGAVGDEWLFRALHRLGGTPRLLDSAIVDPHIENYVALTLLAAIAARWRGVPSARVVLLVAAAATLSFAAVRAIWAVWERPRPQELLGDVAANSHDWAPYASFPSGHVAVTVAIVVAAARAVPVLRVPLWLYAAVIAVTRVSYGAHFPSDVIGGLAIGLAGALGAAALLKSVGLGPPGFAPSDHRELRAVLGRLLEPRRLLALARIWSLAAVVLFFVLLGTVGPPHGPEGGVLSAADEYVLNRSLLELIAVAAAFAWFRRGIGGAGMLILAILIGVFARLEYSPAIAFLAAVAFFVPALLYLLASGVARTGARRAAVALAAVTLLALGGFAGERVHAMVFGPSHPESALRRLPPSAIEWIWAGGLTPTRVTVNAKLARDGDARLLVSERRSLVDPIASAPKRAEEDRNDRTLAFSVGALRPGRRYFYAVEVDGRIDRTRLGSLRTPARGPFSFTVAFGSCARTGSNGAVYDAIRAQRPLLFLLVGDFFYGNIESNSPRRFREAYAASLTAPAQAALYRSTPVAYIWDDHDYGPNDGDRTSPSRIAAQSVYRQLVPHYLLATRRGPIYQAFTLGRIRFVLSDLRSERSPRENTMLGAAQKTWLKRQLTAAQELGQLVVWASSVPWIAGADAGADTWAGYAAERRELADFIARRGRVLMLAGDAHMLALDDGSNSGYASSGAAGFPVMHAAALDRPGGTKGGPFSEGRIGGSGQFGTMRVKDDGSGPIRITLTGRRYDGSVVFRYAYSVDPARP